MELSDFDYPLPEELIAQRPLRDRAASRMMVLKGYDILHKSFSQLPDYLEPGDTLVINDSRVIPARIRGRKPTGGKVEVLLVKREEGGRWQCLINGKRIRPGTEIFFASDFKAEVKEKVNGKYTLELDYRLPLGEHLKEWGEMPTPPYIKKKLEDRERYQTVYSKKEGSIAAPTAGLHFTAGILEEIEKRGVNIVPVTLHVSPGTFMPVKSKDIRKHKMEEEHYEIPVNTAVTINRTLNKGKKLFAVGTTSLKTLESAVEGDMIVPGVGSSDLFIYPGYKFKSGVSGLLTNFHLPKSSLLMLVTAFYGRKKVFKAYKEAIKKRYRFFSFGDAMLMVRG